MEPDSRPKCSITHLLSSNAVPTPIEADAIRRELPGLQANITKLSEEIDRDEESETKEFDAKEKELKTQLGELQWRHREELRRLEERRRTEVKPLQDKLERYTASLSSPIRRLPLEVLGEIFLYALPLLPVRDGRRNLVSVMLVCKAWLEATLLCPRLWNRVATRPIRTTEDYEKVKAWLGRAGLVPKSFETGVLDGPGCDCRSSPDHANCHLASPVLGPLIEDIFNLQNLIIKSSSTACFARFLKFFQQYAKGQDPLSSISSLELAFNRIDFLHGYEGEPLAGVVASFFNRLQPMSFKVRLPNPRFYKFTSGVSQNPLTHISTPFWEGLTTLDIMITTEGRHLYNALKDCANLEVLSLSLYCGSAVDFPERVRLSKVRKVKMEEIINFKLLGHVEFPALEELEAHVDRTTNVDCKQLRAFYEECKAGGRVPEIVIYRSGKELSDEKVVEVLAGADLPADVEEVQKTRRSRDPLRRYY